MEQIKQAVERAKASATGEPLRPMTPLHGQGAPQAAVAAAKSPTPKSEPIASHAGSALRFNEVALDWSHLEQHRIIGHNVADPRSKVFDVLRTQVLQAMDQKNWQFLAITSPTEGCGKTVTAINLALSIARQPERSALLIDMDLQRPTVANYLGIKVPAGRAGYPRGASNARGRSHSRACRQLRDYGSSGGSPDSALVGINRLSQHGHDVAGY